LESLAAQRQNRRGSGRVERHPTHPPRQRRSLQRARGRLLIRPGARAAVWRS